MLEASWRPVWTERWSGCLRASITRLGVGLLRAHIYTAGWENLVTMHTDVC